MGTGACWVLGAISRPFHNCKSQNVESDHKAATLTCAMAIFASAGKVFVVEEVDGFENIKCLTPERRVFTHIQMTKHVRSKQMGGE